jgi:predicted transcriptional regulator
MPGWMPCDGQRSAIWSPYMTSKTTIYLDPDDYRRLKRLARRQGRPAAELVREAVAEYARRHAPAAAPRSVGAARTKRRDLSERAEDLLGGIGERA